LAIDDPATRPLWRDLLVWLGWPVALSFMGLLLIGIPGALLMELAAPAVGLFTTRRLPGDSAWPMAIVVSLAWPWFLLPGRWLARAIISSEAPWWRGVGMTSLLIALSAGALLAAILQVGAGRL
jgi:hypothetical protein